MALLLFASLVVNEGPWPFEATGLNWLPSRPEMANVVTLSPLVHLITVAPLAFGTTIGFWLTDAASGRQASRRLR